MKRQIVMFTGVDASNNLELWETNGTVVGTHELTGISGANTTGIIGGISGLIPSGLTVFNGEVLFEGADTSGNFGLWVTDGSAAGTHELTGISNAFSSGLNPQDMTVLGQEVLFAGINANGQLGLWATSGTAASTHELTGISGANASGIFFNTLPLNPDFTVFNGEVLFEGTDTSGNLGLWVTNGTAVGTHELTGISGTFSSGINPSALTVF